MIRCAPARSPCANASIAFGLNDEQVLGRLREPRAHRRQPPRCTSVATVRARTAAREVAWVARIESLRLLSARERLAPLAEGRLNLRRPAQQIGIVRRPRQCGLGLREPARVVTGDEGVVQRTSRMCVRQVWRQRESLERWPYRPSQRWPDRERCLCTRACNHRPCATTPARTSSRAQLPLCSRGSRAAERPVSYRSPLCRAARRYAS